MENKIETIGQVIKKLKEIIEDHERWAEKYVEEEKKLLQYISFTKDHKFDEEYRVANLKFNYASLIIYNYNQVIKEIKQITINQKSNKSKNEFYELNISQIKDIIKRSHDNYDVFVDDEYLIDFINNLKNKK